MRQSRRGRLIGSIVAILGIMLAGAATAAIFGDNQLDGLTRAKTPNQCYLKSGAASPPTGRIYLVKGGSRHPVGSGDTVLAKNIVVTAGHLFWGEDGNHLGPDDKVVFSVWEGKPGSCKRVDYAVEELIVGTTRPVREPSRDFAVLKLAKPVNAYAPLRLGSAGMVGSARGGGKITISGFAGHSSTGGGRDLSVVTCRGYKMGVTDPAWLIANSLIVFDCDTASGMSGSAITSVSGSTRYLVGIATSAMNFSQGKAFNLKDNFNFGYALEGTLRTAIGCMMSGKGCKAFEATRRKF